MSDAFVSISELEFCPPSGSKRDRATRWSSGSKLHRGQSAWSDIEREPLATTVAEVSGPGGISLQPSGDDAESGILWTKILNEELEAKTFVIDKSGKQGISVQFLQDSLSEKWKGDFSLLLSEWTDEAGTGEAVTGFPEDVSIMREAGLPGLAVIFCSIPLIAVSAGAGIAGMFIGSGLFWLANYASYRAGQQGWIVGPAGSAKLFAASVVLAVTAVVAALTN